MNGYKLNSQENLNFINFEGIFIHNSSVLGWPRKFIYLNSSLKPHKLISIYFHENQHYVCVKSKCICHRTNDTTLAEFHAISNQIDQCIEHDMFKPLKYALDSTMCYMSDFRPVAIYHQNAAVMVINSEHWQKAVEYLKGYGVEYYSGNGVVLDPK